MQDKCVVYGGHLWIAGSVGWRCATGDGRLVAEGFWLDCGRDRYRCCYFLLSLCTTIQRSDLCAQGAAGN